MTRHAAQYTREILFVCARQSGHVINCMCKRNSLVPRSFYLAIVRYNIGITVSLHSQLLIDPAHAHVQLSGAVSCLENNTIRVSYSVGTGIPPPPHKFEKYDVIIASTATKGIQKSKA